MALVPVHKRGRSSLVRLHDEMEDLINSFFGGWETPFFQRSRCLAIDIADNEEAVVVKAEVPGCKADDIEISVHGNTLTISGEKKLEEQRKEKGYYHLERSCGSFRRDLDLPADVDPEKVEAVCKDGVLSITLPKTEKAKPIKVNIKGQ